MCVLYVCTDIAITELLGSQYASHSCVDFSYSCAFYIVFRRVLTDV